MEGKTIGGPRSIKGCWTPFGIFSNVWRKYPSGRNNSKSVIQKWYNHGALFTFRSFEWIRNSKTFLIICSKIDGGIRKNNKQDKKTLPRRSQIRTALSDGVKPTFLKLQLDCDWLHNDGSEHRLTGRHYSWLLGILARYYTFYNILFITYYIWRTSWQLFGKDSSLAISMWSLAEMLKQIRW